MESSRVKLINCDAQILQTILKGDKHLAQLLQLEVPLQWSEYGEAVFTYSLARIQEQAGSERWWTYLPIEKEGQVLLGSCGYKGAPDENGMVEIGYEIAQGYRNCGYATEIAALLVAHAFSDPAVNLVQAHTLGERNASVRVLEKCAFIFKGAIEDEEVGTVWKWQIDKSSQSN